MVLGSQVSKFSYENYDHLTGASDDDVVMYYCLCRRH
jgi:hypothetical protein